MRLVNYSQTKEERCQKYWLVKSCGGSRNQATQMKDWRLAKIERFFGLVETYNNHTKGYDRDLEAYTKTGKNGLLQSKSERLFNN